MDPAYGPVPMMSDVDKLREMAPKQSPQIKEERSKESHSPNDHSKVIKVFISGIRDKFLPIVLKSLKAKIITSFTKDAG